MAKLTFYSQVRKPKSLGMGVFDGVHLGHQALLDQCESVLTFNPHPAVVVKGVKALKRLTTIDEMTRYIPNLISLAFTKEVAALTATAFLQTIILEQIQPQALVVGYDYFFGSKRNGNPEMLQKWGKEHGINVTVIQPVTEADVPVKSKAIREAFCVGDVNQALAHLGHSYLMKGTVVKGDGRGKRLGFPTANVVFPEQKLIPQHGVYKGQIEIQGQLYKSVIYIGDRPTFDTGQHAVEVFIPGFDGDLYGCDVDVYIERFLRGEQVFESTASLIAQIRKDVAS